MVFTWATILKLKADFHNRDVFLWSPNLRKNEQNDLNIRKIKTMHYPI
jgi:hypothetical protein